ncbi:hypothetical protein A8C32_00795 [Flavivirga aquatica]|uniref:Uncharacterized protein n=1 Tax=Flavivirga aquatica TaxID=1849968 RepID=A0A1E5TBW5_9FLAO|nr:glycosyltransferase [Flavivirga aquatica]OEK08846.1 hypothetical protein A8C32_00795 [Flavivirga aquatica]
MRKGKNISKNELLNLADCSHRIIIPLYIPNLEGYYKEAFEIFKMCLFSINRTSISLVKISVISNNCCEEVNNKLFELYQKKDIDELIIEQEAIGKINSILKALRTVEERLITITDADVLFLNNWEKEVIKVFKAYPKAGMVSPVPIFRTHLRYTKNIWFRYFFSNKLKFRKVKNPEAMTRFANSLGWSYLSEKLKDVVLTLEAKNKTLAVVGNAHFVGTYKREVFKLLPEGNSDYLLGGNSEKLYTDIPVIKSGGYRLATYNNYAYHLGNKLEDWMVDEFDNLIQETKKYEDFNDLKKLKPSKLNYIISEKLFGKLFYNKLFKNLSFKLKGLNKTQLANFLDNNYE